MAHRRHLTAAIEAYHHARHRAATLPDARECDLYDSVVLVIVSNAAIIGVLVD